MIDIHDFMHHVDDLILAILIMMITVYTCNLLRIILLHGSLLSKLGANSHDYRMAIVEAIGSMESCVIAFELKFIILEIFGDAIYTISVFFVLMWQYKRSSEFFYYANPSTIVAKHVKAVRSGGMGEFSSYTFVATMILGELVGAYLAYQFLQEIILRNVSYWTFWKSSNYHMKKWGSWSSSLKSSVNFAMMIEGGFSFLSYIWPKVIQHRTHFSGDSALMMSNLGKAIFCGIGAQYTGGYYNPIQATALEYYSGSSLTTKFQVYWLAPIIGTITALFLF